MVFQFQNCKLEFTHRIVYELNGKVMSDEMVFTEDNTWNNSVFLVTRLINISKNTPSIMDISFQIQNKGSENVILKECILVDMPDSSMLKLGEEEISNYQFFRQGRHKNDLPSVCTLGTFDQRFEDACGGMLETGAGIDNNQKQHKLVSDQMTIIYGSDKEHVLLGFLTGCDQFFNTTLELDEEGSWINLSSKTTFDIVLQPGKLVTSELLRIDLSEDVFEKIDQFALYKADRYHSRRKPTAPTVFCTWYYYGLTVTYEDVVENLTEMKKLQLPFDVFQVDEGWEITLGEWEPNEKFPKPMKEVAKEIVEAGYTPGIWTSPFIGKETCSIWKKHPEWILKDKEGNPCIFHMNDTTYYVFDITNPATHQYFYELYQMLRYDWGYTYHKLDFTRAAVIYPEADFFDKTITLVSAYYKAVCAIRSGMGEDAYFLMCGGLYDPLIGIVDAQRVGADVLSMWSSNIDKGGKTAPYTIKQNMFRYYMNHWWDNDPDALMVRRNEVMERDLRLTYGLLNEEEVKTSTLNQFIGGGLVCSTEPLKKIDQDRLYQIKHIIPTVPLRVIPKDIFKGTRYPSIITMEVGNPIYHMAAIINWEDDLEIPATITLDQNVIVDETEFNSKQVGFIENMNKASEYVVCEFYSGLHRTNVKPGDTVYFGSIAPHGCALFKIEKMTCNKPIIIASNAHYSMGEEVEVLKIENNYLVFSLNYLFNDESTYRILLPEGYSFKDSSLIADITIKEKGYFKKEIPVIRKEKTKE